MELPKQNTLLMEGALVLQKVAFVAVHEAWLGHWPASVAPVALALVPVQLQWVPVLNPMMLLLCLQHAALRMHACDSLVKEIVDLE